MIASSAFPVDAAGWLGVLLPIWAKAALVLLAAAVLGLALRRASAALRHLIWALAIVCVLCLPVFSIALPSWHLRALPRYAAAPTDSHSMPESLTPPLTDEVMVGASSAGQITAETGPPTAATNPRAPTNPSSRSVPAASPTLSERIPGLLVLVWALGALTAFVRVALSMVSVRRAVRQVRRLTDPSWQKLVHDAAAQLRLRRPVTLLSSQCERVPMVWGWWHAMLLLPVDAEEWSQERRRLVILHELAHVKRADCLTQMLGYLAHALYWFNPLAWLVIRQLRREREQACDDLVLNSGLRSSDYAAHLLQIAGRLQRPTLTQMAAVAMARPAGLEARIRAILDARRSRRAVPRFWALMVALAAAGLLAAVASVQGADVQLADGTTLHGLGAREQWQPQTESDPRLQHPVHFEILGRAAVPVLAMLSEQTGVSLTVAPEDLDTVGERKLTIIAQGCTLKALMAQIPKALQECHWDTDPSGPEPVYLLHRNAGAALIMDRLADEYWSRYSEGRRVRRALRIEAARKTLAMSEQELAELEKSDLLLARTVRAPDARAMLELFLSLPPDNMRQFIDTGNTAMDYFDAPEPFRQAAGRLVQTTQDESADKANSARLDLANFLQDSLSQTTISYEDSLDGGAYLRVFAYDETERRRSCGEDVLLPRFPRGNIHPVVYRPLLLASGAPDEEAADAIFSEWQSKGAKEVQEQRERRAESTQPTDPELQHTVALKSEDRLEFVEIERMIAGETGFSVVSDYFTCLSAPVPEEARAGLPLWRFLYLAGECWRYKWEKVGNCLVFHSNDWYRLAPQEIPESLILACREKLERQGRLTLDDLAALAVSLAGRALRYEAFPVDLQRAGLSGPTVLSGPLLLYASLAPEQVAKARSPSGLSFADMTRVQREQVRQRAAALSPPVPEERVPQAVFRLKESVVKWGSQQRARHDLALEFPESRDQTVLLLGLPEPVPVDRP